MKFRAYQHIARFGTTEVDGIEIGTCYVFPKIDGTNGSIWQDTGQICYGSRKRHLGETDDNHNFLYAMEQEQGEGVRKLLQDHPNYRVYGEWLVPHTLKTYRKDAWQKFYVFDVVEEKSEEIWRHLPYEEYQPLLEAYKINYIPCIGKYVNGTYEAFLKCLEGNTFLIEDGRGDGEGIVIKNYEFVNKYGRQTWAKIVASEFKEKHVRDNIPEKLSKVNAADKIVDEYCTAALIEKTYAKIVAESNGWSSKFIPRLLNTVYHDLVEEECWNFVKKFKNPVVDFKRVQNLTTEKIKQTKPELF